MNGASSLMLRPVPQGSPLPSGWPERRAPRDASLCRPERFRASRQSRLPVLVLPELLRRLPELAPLFEGLDKRRSLEIEGALEWVTLVAGETLFEQGDAASDAFVLTAGRLAVQINAGSERRTVAHLEPGELVGEMALLADAPRSATIVALHDSHLIRLPRAALDILLAAAPEARNFFFHILTARLRQTSVSASPIEAPGERVAIVPLGPVEPLQETLDWLSSKLSPTTMGDECEEERWEERRPTSFGERRVYMAVDRYSPWSRRCVDHADRVIFVADAESVPADLDLVGRATDINRETHLVLINPVDRSLPIGAEAWLNRFPISQILHVRRGDKDDHERILRLICRSSVCLVFSGAAPGPSRTSGLSGRWRKRAFPSTRSPEPAWAL